MYQHPEVAELKVSSPTLSRIGKMLTLQWRAFNNAEECAKSAFLRGDGHEMQDTEAVYARALDDIACAMFVSDSVEFRGKYNVLYVWCPTLPESAP